MPSGIAMDFHEGTFSLEIGGWFIFDRYVFMLSGPSFPFGGTSIAAAMEGESMPEKRNFVLESYGEERRPSPDQSMQSRSPSNKHKTSLCFFLFFSCCFVLADFDFRQREGLREVLDAMSLPAEAYLVQ
ncbi:hypothetical protein CEXT_605861 [Caerostris extrusa]|uniref:Uncharacterized protein n=1 Tax=Caerostris extrusa TaxID=172846 RepID=A0AAV4WNM4_CAEEX|nr:hypothetical protein CEXT_605861 [Caerostris extrusa]